MKKIVCVMMSFLLLVMSVPMEGMASSVSENEIEVESSGVKIENIVNPDGEVLIEGPERTLASNISSESIDQSGASTISNPVHCCTGESNGTDTGIWSYVYFGSYPQTEVTDSETIVAIDNAISLGTENANAATDVWVNGIKYRRLCISNADSVYRYFKWERIRWKVLNNDGETLFVVSDKALDCQKYNEDFSCITWEDSTIRKWLNDSFYNTAFDASEWDAIVTQNVTNADNAVYEIEGGNDTMDEVYLLSIEEITNEEYGFCDDWGLNSASRRVQSSDYACVQGADSFNDSALGCFDTCWWWLRSPGEYYDLAACVEPGGFGYIMGEDVDLSDGGVVPALHIDITSDTWFLTEDGISGAGREELANPVHNCTGKDDGTDSTTWSYLYFGSYPQSEVTDDTTIENIEAAIEAGNGSGDTGIDVWVDGTKYRRISKNDINSVDNFGDSTYLYFKWERIKWRVLDNDGATVFVMSDQALDCEYFNNEWMETTWENSTIRSWLNGSFYNTAFNNSEQGAIEAQKIINEDNTDYGTEGGNDTTDNVYLLSFSEVMDVAYGFCNNSNVGSASRQLQSSAYAVEAGLDEGKCSWWLRSPGNNTYLVGDVRSSGLIDEEGFATNDYYVGVVPVLHLKLSADSWLLEDDGTSGNGGEEKDDSVNGTDNGSSNMNGNSNTNNNVAVNQNNTVTGNNQTGAGQNTGSATVNDVKVTSLSITAPSKKLAAGKKVNLSVEVTPSNATNSAVTWQTSNTKYATIDQNGKLTLKKAGIGKSVTVTATATDGSGVKATYKIKIMKHAVKSIKLSAASKSVTAGKSIKLKVTIKTTGKKVNKKLKWTSSNTKYATVTKSGKVKTKKAGKGKTVKITAQATDGTGKKASIKIKIK